MVDGGDASMEKSIKKTHVIDKVTKRNKQRNKRKNTYYTVITTVHNGQATTNDQATTRRQATT